MKLIITLLFSVLCISIYSQTERPFIEWEKSYGGNGIEVLNSMIATDDGGFLLGGTTTSNDEDIKSGNLGDKDFWVVKIDSNGILEWEKTYGGSNEDVLTSMITTVDNSYLLVGHSKSEDGDVTQGNKGKYDGLIIKISSTGSIEWSKSYYGPESGDLMDPMSTYVGAGSRNDNLNSISSDIGKEFVIAGQTYKSVGDLGVFNASWIFKIDLEGDLIWEKINTPGITKYIINDSNGNYIVQSYHTLNDWYYRCIPYSYIKKINESGATQWTYSFSTNNYIEPYELDINYVTICDNGSSLYAGEYYLKRINIIGYPNQFEYNGPVIKKLNSNGRLEWEKTYEDQIDEGYISNYSFNYIKCILPDNMNEYFLLAQNSLIKLDSIGNIIYKKEISDANNLLCYSNSGTLFAAGTSEDKYFIQKISFQNKPSNITLSNNKIKENSSRGTFIGKLTTTNYDIMDSYDYTLVGNNNSNSLFYISNDSLFSNDSFDFELQDSLVITIQTTDSKGNQFTKSLDITIEDSNDSPTDIKWLNIDINDYPRINENLPINSSIGSFYSIDQDISDSHSYSFVKPIKFIVDSTEIEKYHNDAFIITGNELVVNDSIDYEYIGDTCKILIKSKDKQGEAIIKSLSIIINNTIEQPNSIILSDTVINENSQAGTYIGKFKTAGEVSLNYKYQLVSDNKTDNNSFFIRNDSLFCDKEINYERQRELLIRVLSKANSGYTLQRYFNIRVLNLNDIKITSQDIKDSYCFDEGSGRIILSVSDFNSPVSYKWSNGDTTLNLFRLKPGEYTLTITDNANMQLLQTFTVGKIPIYDESKICYVASFNTSNILCLDKGSSPYNTYSYNIYRESSNLDHFNKIGEIITDQNFFIDSLIDNRNNSYCYKISMKDKCGLESNLSEPHSTIHLSANLSISNNINLYWNSYIGLDIPSYLIYRRTDNQNFKLITELSSNTNTYTDLTANPYEHQYEYYVAFKINNSCYKTIDNILMSTNLSDDNYFGIIKSNIYKFNLSNSISELYNSPSIICPNPINGNFININNALYNFDHITIKDLSGKTILGKDLYQYETKLDVSNLSDGIYLAILYKKNTIIKVVKLLK